MWSCNQILTNKRWFDILPGWGGVCGRVIGLGIVVLLLPACSGYHLLTTGQSAISEFAVPGVINNTSEPFLSERMTRALHRRLPDHGILIRTGGPLALQVRVTAFEDRVRTFDAGLVASERQVRMTVTVQLVQDGAGVWQQTGMAATAVYPVSGDTTRNRDQKDRAVEDAARALAEEIAVALSLLDPAILAADRQPLHEPDRDRLDAPEMFTPEVDE